MTHPKYILTLACPDELGIVYAVSGFLVKHGGNIIDSAQFGDRGTGLFFMRVHFGLRGSSTDLATLRHDFAAVAENFVMRWEIADTSVKPRLLLMVSRFGHCLNDLLFRYSSGTLPVEIPAIVSNHPDFYQLAASHNIPYYHVPVSAPTKDKAEARLLEIVHENQVDLVVLARYMQVLSNELCATLAGRAINIHHSFLPSFKGAKPYRQAHDRGVKLIGATAHYVTGDLDEGPIIEQDVARVDHAMDPETLTAIGRDVESVVLARAVMWHVERRVILNDGRAVVFR